MRTLGIDSAGWLRSREWATRVAGGFAVVALVAACAVKAPAPQTAPAPTPPRPTPVDAQALARAKNCLACHAVSQRVVGPAFSVVARAQQGNPNALAQMEQRIRAGSVNVWGPVPMPAMPTVSREEAHVLAQWVMTLSSAPLPPVAPAPAVPLAAASAPAAATPARPPVRDPVFDKLALGGVRPGMTRQQAVAALKVDNPRLLIFEAYTTVGMGMLWTGAAVKPDHSGFFSRLIAVAPDDPVFARAGGHENYKSSAYFGVASCYVGPVSKPGRKESVVLVVDFSPSLADPRVVLIRESRHYCRGAVPSDRDVIADLYRKYPMATSATFGLNDKGTRIGPDPSVSRYFAFIEWRAGGPTLRVLDERYGTGDADAGLARNAMGHAGGGLVLHAEIGIGFPSEVEYLTTLLWNEDAMTDHGKRQGLLLTRMDQADVMVGDVNDPKKRERVDMRDVERPMR